MSETAAPEKKKKKPKGPIRYEAIVPVLIICILTFVYFSYFFDRHLKSLIEYVGTQANGAEVNVSSVNTSFVRASFDLNGLQVTDAEKPVQNILEIENIHFQYLWDALLRMKFVVEDASISNIQLLKPRKHPGYVLPPKPASPSKIESLQNEVYAQVKNKYGANVLGNVVSLLQGGDYKDQIEQIRGTLKSETRAKEMVADVQGKREVWDKKIKEVSDTSKLKEVEQQVNTISKEKNALKQAQGIKQLTDLLKDVQKKYKEVETASNQLQNEVKAVTQYPNELQKLVNEDVNALKDRFKIPKIDFKDMAMHLFAGEFAGYIAKARKYQAIAKEYLPEKKKEKEEVIPPKRSAGHNYQFPVTTGYPLFWLKRAAISSKGTADSYSGDVSGELTNVTTAPAQIGKPMVLDLNGDFPAVKVHGVRALFTVDHTRPVGKQSALIQVNSFQVPEKMFTEDKNLKFGFLNAIGASTIKATLEQEHINMSWTSALTKPQFLVETESKIAKELITKVVNNIPVIHINGNAGGTFKNLKMNIESNLGEELGQGFTREIGLKVAEAQHKLQSLVDEKINGPKQQLDGQVKGSLQDVNSLNGIKDLYKKNEDRIKAEIAKFQSGGGMDKLKEQGKKIFKGIKL
jgi:uncharacterized protein (TIGR03545 family)